MSYRNVILMMGFLSLFGCKSLFESDSSIHPAIDPVYYKSLPEQAAKPKSDVEPVSDSQVSTKVDEPAPARPHIAPASKKKATRKRKEAAYLSPGMDQTSDSRWQRYK